MPFFAERKGKRRLNWECMPEKKMGVWRSQVIRIAKVRIRANQMAIEKRRKSA